MAAFLGYPLFTAFDSNGDPLSGGKLHVYEVGTTTNKNSYPTIADADAATNANANPVILDSRGEAAVVVIGATKFVLKDSADVTIWTVDNVDLQTTTAPDPIVDSNGNQVLIFGETASAVNEVTITNAATAGTPLVSASGDDANIDLALRPKGTGGVVLQDGTGNEVLKMASGVASAVNYVELTNAAAGSDPSVSVNGSDTNIDLVLKGKGTGRIEIEELLTVTGTAASAGAIRLGEDSDNGTNYMGFQSPAAVTTSTELILPDGDGTNAQYLGTNGSATLSWQSIRDDLGVTKAWVKFDGTGTISAYSSLNLSSLVDLGTGDYQVIWNTNFSNTNYAMAVSGPAGSHVTGTGSTNLGIYNASHVLIKTSNSAFTGTDVDAISVIAVGSLA